MANTGTEQYLPEDDSLVFGPWAEKECSGRRSRDPWRLLGFLWPAINLAWLVPEVASVIQIHSSPLGTALRVAGIALFGVAWIWLIAPGPIWVRGVERWSLLLLLTALSCVYSIFVGDSLGLFIFVAVAAGFVLKQRHATATIISLVVIAAVCGFISGADMPGASYNFLLIFTLGMSMIFWGRLIEANHKLRAAREEIARLAVSEERLRFARDLHDLLGHSLSSIALKSELARRLVTDNPERAEQEITEIEGVVRDALKEVREAVSGYRQTTLHAELYRAREILRAADIEYLREGEIPRLAPGGEQVISWVVREGVTNVVRHSRASQCRITLRTKSDAVEVEIEDDGVGCQSHESASKPHGNGLTGLRERVASANGHLAIDSPPGGGLRLLAAVPADARVEVLV